MSRYSKETRDAIRKRIARLLRNRAALAYEYNPFFRI